MEQILDGPKIWDEIFFGGQNVGDSELIFWGPKDPQNFMTFFMKRRATATFWGVDDLLRLRLRIAMFFQVWLTVWGIQLQMTQMEKIMWAERTVVQAPRRKLQELGKSHVFLSDK